jgi:uncharacterized protein
MATSRSIQRVVNKAKTADAKVRAKAAKSSQKTLDSFVNFSMKMGMGADNPMSSSSYGFNPVSRVRTLLEWIHRGSWIGGVAVDIIAEDMTREGVDIDGELDPKSIQALHREAVRLNIWQGLRDNTAWSRLYGGSIAVLLIDGQKPETPLNLSAIGKGQFKGLLVLDRWMVEPSLSDLVTEFGPHLGLPKFYTVTADAPALPRMRIHHSRVIRQEGIRLPYWQKLQENLWGISILERIYDRLVAFDSATQGAAQLVHKAYVRTYKIEGMREIIASGGSGSDGAALNGLVQYVEMVRRFQGIEGVTIMDKEDEFEGIVSNPFSGLSDVLIQFGQQLSGALQVPLVRMFGQSPAGFNTGESDMRNYYDGVNQKQESELAEGVNLIYRVMAASIGILLPEDFTVSFRSLWQLSDKEKSEIAQSDATTISTAESSGLIDLQTALKELKQSSRVTGRFTNITSEMIQEAEGQMAPSGEDVLKEDDTNIVSKPETPVVAKDHLTHAAGVLIFCGNKFLILRRSQTSLRPGVWDLPGGHIEQNETPSQAAFRECDEEIGYIPHIVRQIDRSECEGVEYVTFIADEPSIFDPSMNTEHDQYEWVTIEKALEKQLHPGLRSLLRRLA